MKNLNGGRRSQTSCKVDPRKNSSPIEAIFEMARQVRPDDTSQAISLRGEVPFHSTPSLVVPQEVINRAYVE